MSADIGGNDLERFRSAIASGLGLYFDEGKSGLLSDVLRRRMDATRQNAAGYLLALEQAPTRNELSALGRELTVPETYFFRGIEQYHALRDIVLPQRLAKRAAERRLRILSLGCASGEEAYSLAMLVRDVVPPEAWDVSVVGVDVNPAMIDKARRGRFSAWALRQTPEHDRRRWFRADGSEFVLDSEIRAAVRFEERNLTDDDPRFWQRGVYDIVFCRNVIMYFAPEQARALIDRIARALSEDGYLFLGYAETLRGLSTAFHLRHTHGTFYYQLKDHDGSVAPELRAESSAVPTRSLVAAAETADTWVEAIQRASERVAALADSQRQLRSDQRATSSAQGWDLGVALELLRKEHFAEALAMIDALPPESGRDPDVLLLRAVLLVHTGQCASAETACRHLLEVDELSAGAHYLLALCRESAADPAGATYHDQVATYLDPTFAMPHLRSGLAARRSGQWAVARRELAEALALLHREDASRILLFGGGFGRDALIALCRTELARCGEDRAR